MGIDLDELAKAYYAEGEEEEPEQGEYQDPGELALQKFEDFQREQQTRQEQEAFREQILDDMEALEQAEGHELSNASVQMMEAMAYQHGMPPQESFKLLQEVYDEGALYKSKKAEKDAEAKERKRSAAKAPSGGSGTREKNLKPDELRDELEREIEHARHSQQS